MSAEPRHKILFLIRSLDVGGAERQLVELAAGLRRAGCSVKVATFYGGGALAPLLAAHGVAHVSLDKRDRWHVLPFVRRLVALIRAERPDVVYSMLSMSNILLALVARFVRPARIVWGVAASNMDLSLYDWMARVEAPLQKLLAPRADLIIFNSIAGRDYYAARGYPADRLAVVGNGIDTVQFRPDANARREVRAEWNIGPGEIVVGIIGRLDPIKDHVNFLAAAAQAASVRPELRFVCVGGGSGEYCDALPAQAAALGIGERVLWVGERTDIWRVYNALDVLVSSSISEGLANVIAEAMATGVPCVATAVGDSARIVANPRYLAPPRDSARLARAMLNAVDDLSGTRHDLRQKIVDEHGLERLARSTIDQLTAVVGRVRRSPRAPERAGEAGGPTAPAIVLLTRKLDLGGAQRQLVELARGMQDAGWRVKVVTFYAGGKLGSSLELSDVDVVHVDKKGRWDLLGFAWRLLKVIRGAKPDVLHGYLSSSNILLTLLRPFCGKAKVVWGVRASNLDMSRYDMLSRMEEWVAARLAPLADLIICNAEAGRAYHVAQGFPAERTVVVPNGIDLQRFRPDEDARRQLRQEWHIDNDAVLVGIVARLDPMKDHDSFLQAAAQVAALRPQVRFICVGDGPDDYRLALQRRAQSLGLADRLVWGGARYDVERACNAFDIAVSASAFGEGFSNVIAEAMATGVPCVVTDVGDSAAIVGTLGWVCPPQDSKRLADALVAAIDALPCDRQRLRAHIAANYSASLLIERTMARLAPLAADVAPRRAYTREQS